MKSGRRKCLRNRHTLSALPFRKSGTSACRFDGDRFEQRQGIIGPGRITRMTAVARIADVIRVTVAENTT